MKTFLSARVYVQARFQIIWAWTLLIKPARLIWKITMFLRRRISDSGLYCSAVFQIVVSGA